MKLYLNPHQTRTGEPTPLENSIADVIERCYANGQQTCEELVQALNATQVPDPDGKAWTIDSFMKEMARLGA